MAEKRYYWLKLYEDFFSSKRIKKLRAIAGGNTYTIIYLKMLLKAMKDEGYLYFDGIMNNFSEELALDIDENVDDVKVTLNYLLSVGLIESNNDDVFKLTYIDTMVGSETAAAQRARDFREKKKALRCNNNVQKRNKCVTQASQIANVEKEIEIEKEIDIECREKRKRFIPPTLEEVQAYVKERKSNVDPRRFYEYYETGGWKDGKGQQVKNWKQKLITWEKKDTSKSKFNDFPNADRDYADLEKQIYAN